MNFKFSKEMNSNDYPLNSGQYKEEMSHQTIGIEPLLRGSEKEDFALIMVNPKNM